MRYRIKDYTISGQTITIQGEFDIEDIRLIVDETQKEILCSSTDKNLDGVVYDGGLDATIITIPLSICRLVNTDKLTIEVDCGDSPADLAQQGSNVEATNSAILSAINGIATSMYKGVPIVSQVGDATIAPNVWNVWESVAGNLRISKGAAIEGVVNNYMLRFKVTGSTSVVFTGFNLRWYGGVPPTWTAGYTYEVSIIDNVALWAEIA